MTLHYKSSRSNIHVLEFGDKERQCVEHVPAAESQEMSWTPAAHVTRDVAVKPLEVFVLCVLTWSRAEQHKVRMYFECEYL